MEATQIIQIMETILMEMVMVQTMVIIGIIMEDMFRQVTTQM